MSNWRPLLEICDIDAVYNITAPTPPTNKFTCGGLESFVWPFELDVTVKPQFQIPFESGTATQFFRICAVVDVPDSDLSGYEYWGFHERRTGDTVSNDEDDYGQTEGNSFVSTFPSRFNDGGNFEATGVASYAARYYLFDWSIQTNVLKLRRATGQGTINNPPDSIRFYIQKVNGQFSDAIDLTIDTDGEQPRPFTLFTDPNWWTQFNYSEEYEFKRQYGLVPLL